MYQRLHTPYSIGSPLDSEISLVAEDAAAALLDPPPPLCFFIVEKHRIPASATARKQSMSRGSGDDDDDVDVELGSELQNASNASSSAAAVSGSCKFSFFPLLLLAPWLSSLLVRNVSRAN